MTYLTAPFVWISNLVGGILFVTYMGLIGTFIPVGVVALALIFLGAAILQYLKPRQLTRRIWQWNFIVLGAWLAYIWFQVLFHGMH